MTMLQWVLTRSCASILARRRSLSLLTTCTTTRSWKPDSLVTKMKHPRTTRAMNTTTRQHSSRTSRRHRNALGRFFLQPRTLPVPRWISPTHYTITLSEVCGHASFVLVALSYAVDDFLHLRIIAVAGSTVMLCFTYFHPHGRVLWLPFQWNVLFIAINSYRIGKVLLDRYWAEQLPPEMLKLRNKYFETIFDPPDFAKLVRTGHLETLNKGDLLVAQGERNNVIRLMVEGECAVLRDGKVNYLVEEGNFLAETGLHAGLLLPGRVESCCSIVVTSPTVKLWVWERNHLMDLLHREKNLRRNLKAALSWDIVRKLKGQRLRLLQIDEDPEDWTKRRTEQNHHRYAAILENMVHHSKHLKERKDDLKLYRLIHHIYDEQHEEALRRNGWTVEDFERGYREGHELEDDEDDDIKRDFRWLLHDIYMRTFG